MRTFLALLIAITCITEFAHAADAQPWRYNPYAAQQAQAMYLQQLRAQQLAEWQREAELRREAAEAIQRQQAAAVALQHDMDDENAAAAAGEREIQTHGWGRISARVNKVVSQLETWSGESFSVVPSQTGNWGQAHAGGIIYFDVSSAMQSDTILAFRLAHEWGHEVLGHQTNVYNPTGRPRMISSPTQDEDEADVYAGRFLCSNGYDVTAVEADLRRYPAITGDSHSSGAKRAQNVQQGCDEVGSQSSADDTTDDQ